MHPLQGEHHAGQRGAERSGKAGGGTGGDQIMLLHILAAFAAQPMRQELRARSADLDGWSFAAK